MFEFCWVTDFPMFEWDEDGERWSAVHHPFTRPTAEWVDRFDEDPKHAIAHAYDLIGNGNELGGGSFRIHEPEIQARVFDLLKITGEEQRVKFGFLLDALAMGAPPHGGIAFGIDRMLMVLAQEPNLRDTIAFPKNQAGVDPMTGAPADVTQEQLRELGIRIVEKRLSAGSACRADAGVILRGRRSASRGGSSSMAAQEPSQVAPRADAPALDRRSARARATATTATASARPSTPSAGTSRSSRCSSACSRRPGAPRRSSRAATRCGWTRST